MPGMQPDRSSRDPEQETLDLDGLSFEEPGAPTVDSHPSGAHPSAGSSAAPAANQRGSDRRRSSEGGEPAAPGGPQAPVRTASELRDGALVGRYRIEALLGEGGMGRVYRARHIHLDREVALKVLRSEISTRPTVKERFLREARLTSRISHPAVIHIHDFDSAEGLCYLTMELVSGRPLDEHLIEHGAMPPPRAALILGQVLQALEAAHEKDVVHRDLKPSNVMLLHDDRVKVVDFGIARLLDDAASGGGALAGLTKVGDFVGTPAYAAPEQIQARGVDGRADLYAAGIIFFELLTGRLPFESKTPHGYLAQHMAFEPPRLLEVSPDLPRAAELDAFVQRALAKDPKDRYASARAMLHALRELMGPALVLDGAAGAAGPQLDAAAARAEPAVTAALVVAAKRERTKLFVVGGDAMRLGRSRHDARRGGQNDVLLRVLPCRDPQRDPENWAASLRISGTQLALRIDAAGAWVRDMSARGTLMDGKPLPTTEDAPLPEAFELDVGAGALALKGALVRSAAASSGLDWAATELGVGQRPAKVEAVILWRASNATDHVYVLLAGALALNGAPDQPVVCPALPPGILSLRWRAGQLELHQAGEPAPADAPRGVVGRLLGAFGGKAPPSLLVDGRPPPPGAPIALSRTMQLRYGSTDIQVVTPTPEGMLSEL